MSESTGLKKIVNCFSKFVFSSVDIGSVCPFHLLVIGLKIIRITYERTK